MSHQKRVKEKIAELAKLWKSTRKIANYFKQEHDYDIAHTSVNHIIRTQDQNIEEYSEHRGVQPDNVKHYRHKTKMEDWSSISAFVKNDIDERKLERLKDDIVAMAKEYAPKYPTIKRKQSKDPHLLVIDPADIHIGKLCSAFETGEEYNQQIAVQRVLEWVKGILDKTSTYQIDKVLFIAWNDILHIDSPKRTTTSWTPQDTDWMRYDNFMIAKKLYIDVLEMILTVADIDFVYNPSNHDFVHGFMLCQTVEAWFSNNKNINFDTDMKHRKYYKYHNNLIWTTHWDWAKEKDLPLLMATECSVRWSECQKRYCYGHHLHHKTAKDYIGMTYETLRSPSWSDWRHSRNGYVWVPKAIEGFLHHPEHWQIARITHFF